MDNEESKQLNTIEFAKPREWFLRSMGAISLCAWKVLLHALTFGFDSLGRRKNNGFVQWYLNVVILHSAFLECLVHYCRKFRLWTAVFIVGCCKRFWRPTFHAVKFNGTTS